MQFETPILFLIFNRPDTTKEVFLQIKKQKPKKIYIAGDGARKSVEGEQESVEKTRQMVLNMIDWDCEVKTLFRENNLGCKKAVSEAITWFFENEEMGIILEDDCLPSTSFFGFCEKMLKKYKDNEEIFIISGHNCQGKWKDDKQDYFFSYTGNIWGWASWKRVWDKYDITMKGINTSKAKTQFNKLFGKKYGKIRHTILKRTFLPYISSWDWPFAYNRHMHGGMGCVPSKNLIKNVGFGNNATHTQGTNYKEHESYELDIDNIKENKKIEADREYDEVYIKMRCTPITIHHITRVTDFFRITPFAKKVYNKAKKVIKKSH